MLVPAGKPSSVVLAAASPAPVQPALTHAEIEGLLFMREEEKLAHGVYVRMYEKWGLAVFSNISSAETNHLSALKNLLDRYGLPDAARGNGVGVFTNPDLQLLYDMLIERGNHLRAFVTNLQRRTRETYQPQYLSLQLIIRRS